jgi:hypothetical protein
MFTRPRYAQTPVAAAVAVVVVVARVAVEVAEAVVLPAVLECLSGLYQNRTQAYSLKMSRAGGIRPVALVLRSGFHIASAAR